MEHTLKTWPVYFTRVGLGDKNFEIRYNDRDFQAGDTVVLAEWDDNKEAFTGREIRATINYVLNEAPHFGLKEGYAVFGIVGIFPNYNP